MFDGTLLQVPSCNSLVRLIEFSLASSAPEIVHIHKWQIEGVQFDLAAKHSHLLFQQINQVQLYTCCAHLELLIAYSINGGRVLAVAAPILH